MSRKFFYTLIALTIVASVLIAANKFEKKEPVYFGPGAGEITITLNQTAVPRFGWGNCSKGLTQDWVDHSIFKLELYKDNILLQTASTEDGNWIWENIVTDIQCIHGNEPNIARWQFGDLELDDPGTYKLWIYRETTMSMIDGWDYDGDNLPDVFPAQVYPERWVTINVLDQ
jgi:hypothetical protein